MKIRFKLSVTSSPGLALLCLLKNSSRFSISVTCSSSIAVVINRICFKVRWYPRRITRRRLSRCQRPVPRCFQTTSEATSRSVPNVSADSFDCFKHSSHWSKKPGLVAPLPLRAFRRNPATYQSVTYFMLFYRWGLSFTLRPWCSARAFLYRAQFNGLYRCVTFKVFRLLICFFLLKKLFRVSSVFSLLAQR